MRIAFTLIGMISASVVYSQIHQQVVMHPEDENFPIEVTYRFPEFQDAYLVTPDGKRSQTLKMNFNLFSGLPQFIDPHGDTLFLDDNLASYIYFNDLTYFNNFRKGYFEIALNSMPVRLGVQREWRLVKRKPHIRIPSPARK